MKNKLLSQEFTPDEPYKLVKTLPYLIEHEKEKRTYKYEITASVDKLKRQRISVVETDMRTIVSSVVNITQSLYDGLLNEIVGKIY